MVEENMIPEDWSWDCIGNTCNVYTGGEPSVHSIKSDHPVGDYIYPVLSNGLGNNAVWGYSKDYTLEGPAVSFSSIGTIGHPTLRLGKFTPVIRLKVIIPQSSDNLDVFYLRYALENADFEFNKAGIPNINADTLKTIFIPIPPIKEQRRIAAVLSDLDDYIEKQEMLIEKNKKFRDGMLEELIPNSLSSEMIEEGWNVKPLLKLVSFKQGYSFNASYFTNDNIGVPIIKIGDITTGHTETHYTGNDYYPEHLIENGDIIIGMSGTFNIRKWHGGDAYLNQRCMKMISDDSATIEYLYYYFPRVLREVFENKSATSVRNLLIDDLEQIEILLPKENEQQRIASTMSNLDDNIAKQQAKLDKARKLKQALLNDLISGKIRLDDEAE